MSPSRSSSPGGHRHGQGFALVAVLVALTVITLLASAVALSTQRAVREASENADNFAADVAMTSTRDTLLFLINTQRQTYAGITVDRQVVWSAGQATASRPMNADDFGLPPTLPIGNEIRLDGRPYLGLGGARFSLQDDGGLFSPNWTFDLYRPGFFELLNIPPGDWASLEAKRLDYQDPDDLYRLGGAEAEQYRRAGLRPPTNRTLVTPLEVRQIMGWNDMLADRDDGAVLSLLTTSRNIMVNVNTAPIDVLRTLPGVDETVAKRIVALRESTPYMLGWQFLDTFDIPLDELAPIGLLATGNGTLRLWHNAGGPIRVVHWTLTPTDEGGRPWRIDYELVLPRDDISNDTPARAVASPLLAESGSPRRGGTSPDPDR